MNVTEQTPRGERYSGQGRRFDFFRTGSLVVAQQVILNQPMQPNPGDVRMAALDNRAALAYGVPHAGTVVQYAHSEGQNLQVELSDSSRAFIPVSPFPIVSSVPGQVDYPASIFLFYEGAA